LGPLKRNSIKNNSLQKCVLFGKSSQSEEFKQWYNGLQKKVVDQRKKIKQHDDTQREKQEKVIEKVMIRRAFDKTEKTKQIGMYRSMAANAAPKFKSNHVSLPPISGKTTMTKSKAYSRSPDDRELKSTLFDLTQVGNKDKLRTIALSDMKLPLDETSPEPEKSGSVKSLDFRTHNPFSTISAKEFLDTVEEGVKGSKPIKFKGFGFEETAYYKLLKEEQQKPMTKKDFSRSIDAEKRCLNKNKIKAYQNSLIQKLNVELSQEGQDNLKRVLNKILETTETSLQKHLQSIKIRRKILNPYSIS